MKKVKRLAGGENVQIDVFVASVAYWVIIGALFLMLSRRVSKISRKIDEVERRLKKEEK